MGRFIDFRITVDDENDPELGKKIVEHLTYRKLQAKKPVVWFIGGSSGEGKSYTAIKIMDIVNNLFGIDTVEYLNEQLIYVPIEYATKMNNILFSKDMKKVRAIMIDEGRELLPAKLWYNFVNQAIADINAMSRGVKSLLLIIISQYFKDIDTSVRRTITYYSKCYRPLSGSKVSFTPYTIWEDDRDIDNVKLRKRHIRGYITIRGKRPFLYIPNRLWVTKPREELIEIYESTMREKKAAIIRRKLESILQAIEKELAPKYEKIDYLVNYYIERPDLLNLFLERTENNRFVLRKEFEKAHDLTPSERAEFKRRLLDKLAEKGLAGGKK